MRNKPEKYFWLPLTKEDRETIRKKRMAGQSAASIGREYKVDSHIICALTKDLNACKKKRNGTNKKIIAERFTPELIAELKTSGCSISAISRFLGVRWHLIKEVLGETNYRATVSSKYTKAHYLADGRTDIEIALHFNVSPSTLCRWKRRSLIQIKKKNTYPFLEPGERSNELFIKYMRSTDADLTPKLERATLICAHLQLSDCDSDRYIRSALFWERCYAKSKAKQQIPLVESQFQHG